MVWVDKYNFLWSIEISLRNQPGERRRCMISLNVNGKKYEVDVPADVPLLWVLRDHLKLMGTKYACGIGECGACTVHIDGKAQRSCTMSVGDVKGKKIT